MPTIRREESLPHALVEGDSITITMSHQMYIDGDQSWITYKVSGRVLEEEESQEAHERILGYLTKATERAVKETVRNVRRMSGKEQ